MAEPVPILTVGDLKSEPSRWSDETPVTFRSPLKEQEFRFYRYRPGENLLVLEINEFPETAPVALPSSLPNLFAINVSAILEYTLDNSAGTRTAFTRVYVGLERGHAGFAGYSGR